MPSPPSDSPVIRRIQVAVVEDDAHFCLWLETLLEASPRHALVASAGSLAEALAWHSSPEPWVILVDVGLPDGSGTTLVAPLLQNFPHALVLMLTAVSDDAAILEAIRLGAGGYVLKGATKETLLDAIDDALAGGAPMSPAIARRVLALMRDTPAPAPARTSAPAGDLFAILSTREIEILDLVATGLGDKEVGDHLGMARSTVKNALLGIYQKWRVRSRTEAAVLFTRLRDGRS